MLINLFVDFEDSDDFHNEDVYNYFFHVILNVIDVFERIVFSVYDCFDYVSYYFMFIA